MAKEDVSPSLHQLRAGAPVSQPAMVGDVATNKVGARGVDGYDAAAGQPGQSGFPSDGKRGGGHGAGGSNMQGRNIAQV